MTTYIIRRLLGLVPVLFGVSILVFFLIRMIPGDPVIIMLGEKARLEDIERVREEMGFNRPIYVQYLEYINDIFHGDLGTSIINHTEISDELTYRLPATIEMVVGALGLGILVGVSVGIFSALYRNSWFDVLGMIGALLGVSMPIFWLGLILMYALAVNNQILPPSGRVNAEMMIVQRTGFATIDTLLMGDFKMFLNVLWHMILPTCVLSTTVMPILARMTRSCMLEVLNQDYVRTARAKGLSEKVVILLHALKNALLPLITVIGGQLGGLLGGAILTETIFSWPGMGTWSYRAILSRDYTIVQAAVLVSATIFVFVNLAVDILYAFVDPRVRFD